MSREGLDRLIEQVRQVAYRLHGHIRLVRFYDRLTLSPDAPDLHGQTHQLYHPTTLHG